VPPDSLPDPLDCLSRVERYRWRKNARTAERAHEAEQLGDLRGLAVDRTEVHPVVAAGPDRSLAGSSFASPFAGAVEAIIGERRLVAGRVSRAAWATLMAAATGPEPIRLVGAGRYGPYWTLIFEGPGARLVVLAHRLVLGRRATQGGSDASRPVLQLAG